MNYLVTGAAGFIGSKVSEQLTKDDNNVVTAMANRTKSDPAADPITGADLGAGPGAGRTAPMGE